jgi:hypothetical protein
MVTIDSDQTITGEKTFEKVIINDLSVNKQTTFSTEDGIIHQLTGNTVSDNLDYGNFATYNDEGVKYKGIINKKGTDKFYVFHNQSTIPETSLDLNTQSLASLVVREPVAQNEVATKGYVESHGGGNFLPLSGGTMSGSILMNGNDINSIKELRFNDIGRIFNFNEGEMTIQPGGGKNTLSIKRIGSTVTTMSLNTLTRKTDLFGELNMNNNDINDALSLGLKDSGRITNYFNVTCFETGGESSSGRRKMRFSKRGVPENYLLEMDPYDETLDVKGEIQMNSRKISGLAPPTEPNDVANKAYVDANSGGSNNLPLSGGTMTGLIDMGTNKISGLGLPILGADATNKSYVDNLSNTKMNVNGTSNMTGELKMNNQDIIMSLVLSGDSNEIRWKSTEADNNRILTIGNGNLVMYSQSGTFFALSGTECYTNRILNMSNNKIIGLAPPTEPTDGATKAYVDANSGGGNSLPLSGGIMTGDISLPSNIYLNLGTDNRIGALSNNDIIISRGAGTNKFVSISDTEMEMRNININMGSNRISGMLGGAAGTDAVNVNQMNTRLSLFGGTMNADINMNGNTVSNLKEPANQLDAATKKYVDEQVSAAILGLINMQLPQKADKTLTELELARLNDLIQTLL